VEGVAYFSLFFFSPMGYPVFMKVDYSFELFLDLSLSQPGVLVCLLVAGIGSVVVTGSFVGSGFG